MHFKRKSLVVALAAMLSLSVAGTALGDGATDNVSRVLGGVSPNKQPATGFGAATLFTQVQTYDADSQDIPDKAAERVYIDFDNDIKFDTRKVVKCGASNVTLGAATTEQAIATCPKSIVGSGQAVAQVPLPSPPFPPGATTQVELTVTTFNGPTSTPGGPCTAPADNTGGPEGCEFVGGQPTVILHAYSQQPNNVTIVRGEVQPSPEAGDFGKRLAVTDAPDTGNDAGALILFNSTVGKRTVVKKTVRRNGKRRTITTVYNYISARCQDDGGLEGKEYDFHAEWVYDDGTLDEDTYVQKCAN